MAQISFNVDWLDGSGVNGAELAATWASLRIQAGDSIITKAIAPDTNKVRDSVFAPLYPFAEWLATNWWFLSYEAAERVELGDMDVHRRHGLATAGDGYAYPNLDIRSSGDHVRVQWNRGGREWARVNFLEQGKASIDIDEFQAECSRLIEQVIWRLERHGIEDTFLQEEWSAIQAADEEETEFCKTAAGLGWDPYCIDREKSELVFRLSASLGDALSEAVPALSPERLSANIEALDEVFRKAGDSAISLDHITSLRSQPFLHGDEPGVKPWAAGYELAQRLRGELGLGLDAPSEIAAVSKAFRLPYTTDDALRKLTSSTRLGDLDRIDGVVALPADGKAPCFAIRQGVSHAAWRFAFCRAIAEALTSESPKSLITRARTTRQQRNRAFAAEFLAPSVALKRRVRYDTLQDEDVEDLAYEFGVSPSVIQYQVINHGIANIPQSDH